MLHGDIQNKLKIIKQEGNIMYSTKMNGKILIVGGTWDKNEIISIISVNKMSNLNSDWTFLFTRFNN